MSQHTVEICHCKYSVTLDKYLSCMRFLLSGETFVTWPNGRAAQLCRSRSYRCPQQSCRSVQHGVTHVLTSFHFKSSPVFVSSFYCKKASPVHVGMLCSRRARNSWPELESEGGEGLKRESPSLLQSVLCLCGCTRPISSSAETSFSMCSIT